VSAELLPIPLAPPSPFQWLELDQAARLSGKSEGHLRRLCGDQWAGENPPKARLIQSPGQKSHWQIRSDADASFMPRQVGPEIDSALGVDLRQFPAAVRSKAMTQARILEDWNKALSASKDREASTDLFILQMATQGVTLCRATLYNWSQAYKREGLLGLIDGRARRAAQAAGPDPFLEEIKQLYLDQRKRSLQLCYEMAAGKAHDQGWKICSYKTADRYLKRQEKRTPGLFTFRRQGKKAFVDKHETYLEGDYSTVRSNELWDSDHYRFNVMVQVGTRTDPATGEATPVLGRPWLTSWQDLRSRKIVGHLIRSADPNTDAIIETLHRAAEVHGLPEGAVTDNGKDYDSCDLTGETKSQRRERKKLHITHDLEKIGGIYAALRIVHHHVWPYHGQSKPVERFHRTINERFERLFETYCGRSTADKPEDLPQQLKRGKAPLLEDFIAAFNDWIENDYHQRIHTGDSMNCSPNDAWIANLKAKRTAPANLLEILFQRRIGPVKVGQNGVTYKHLNFGQRELGNLIGQQVYLRVDDRDLSTLSIWSGDDKFLSHASANRRLPKNASHELLREAITEKRRDSRALRASAEPRLRFHVDLVERMHRGVALRNESQGHAAPPTDPTTFIPVRSDMEGQLNAYQEARESTLRMAAGAESLSLESLESAYRRDE